jgi:hypothetical protein
VPTASAQPQPVTPPPSQSAGNGLLTLIQLQAIMGTNRDLSSMRCVGDASSSSSSSYSFERRDFFSLLDFFLLFGN